MKPTLLLAVLFLVAPVAFACPVCVTQPLKFAFQDSKLFFVGKVVRTEKWSATFEVQEQFKGAPASEVTLTTSNSCSMQEFTVGALYLVEATDSMDGGLYAYCGSHTRVLDGDDRELQLVRRRAAFWKTRLGRVSWFRFVRLVARHLPG